MRLCKDCAFFLADCDARNPYTNSRCEHPDSGSINPVSGAQDLGFCSTERSTLGRCGVSGKLFITREAFAEADATIGATALAG